MEIKVHFNKQLELKHDYDNYFTLASPSKTRHPLIKASLLKYKRRD